MGSKRNPKLLRVASIAWFVLVFSAPALACSVASCLDHGPEMDRSLAVLVRHGGKPLPGVHVQITGAAQIERVTGPDGKAVNTALLPGDYWLRADLLGISAGYQCFHVAKKGSLRAKRSVQYSWGDEAPATRAVTGKLLDSQPGIGGHPLWNITHRVRVPIVGAQVDLRNPITSEDFSTRSNQEGAFRFDHIPQGTYVLHVERGNIGRIFDPTDLLLEVNPKATRDQLVLIRTEPSGGSCGGTSLELQ